MTSELRVFAYGTLKKGFSNHDEYCTGALRIYSAWLRGRLFKLSSEIPVISIPGEDILAYGTAGVASDIDTQEKFASFSRTEENTGASPPAGRGWKKVRGELLIFNDPETRLPLMDSLEEFRPGRPSTYMRALVLVNLAGGIQASAWTYIAGTDPASLDEFAGENWD